MNRVLFLLFVAVSGCAGTPTVADVHREADAEEQKLDPVKNGRVLIDEREQEGSLDRAVRVLEYHAAQKPQSAEIQLLAAEAYSRSLEMLEDRKAQERDRVVRLLTRGKPHADAAVALQPGNGAAHYWKACLLLHEADHEKSLGKANEALKQLDLAEKLMPEVDEGGPARMKGKVLAEMPALFGGSLSKAVASYQSSLKVAPNSITTHLWLGEAYVSAGKPDLARKQFEWVIAAKPPPGHERDAAADQKKAEEALKGLR